MTEDSPDDQSSEDGTVLSPDELDITSDENVVEIEDGRYVISPSGGEPKVPSASEPAIDPHEEADEDYDAANVDEAADADESVHRLDADVVHDWLRAHLEAADSKYAFDVTARFEEDVSQRALVSNDVVATFENLIVWYAHHVGPDTPVEDVLGILLVESNLPIRFPPDSIRAFASANGLDDGDSIEALVSAARDAGGVRFPPDED